MQRVLTIPAADVASLYDYSAFYTDGHSVNRVLDSIVNNGELVDRNIAEQDHSRRQIVACAIVHSERRVLCIRRALNAGRPQLRLRYTVLIGGHVDDQDAQQPEQLPHCVARELAEEVGLEVAAPGCPLGVLTDPSNLTGSLHLGVVFAIKAKETMVELQASHDTQEFVHAGKPRKVAFTQVSEMRRLIPKLDPWSRLVSSSLAFREIIGLKPLQTQHKQRFIPFA